MKKDGKIWGRVTATITATDSTGQARSKREQVNNKDERIS